VKRLRLDALVKQKQGCSWGQARELITTGKVFLDSSVVRDIALLVEENKAFELKMNAPRRARPRADDLGAEILFDDPHLVVLNKKAGLSSVPFEGSEPDSLQTRLEDHLRLRLRVVQRLDKETSGVLLFAKTPQAEKNLAQQFRFHRLKRIYVAIVHGTPLSQTFRSTLVPDRGDGLRGSLRPGIRAPREEQKEAITHVAPLVSLGESSWIRCELETGRTHQIRIHLSEAGHPLVGEKLYTRDYVGPRVQARRTLLHAAHLSLLHPAYEGRVASWSAPLPEDLRTFLEEKLSSQEIDRLFSSTF